MKTKKMIVGIDPGTTSAVAALTLKGKFIDVFSQKNFGKNKIIKHISSLGSPTIIATDKAVPPSMVMKVSSNFNSMLFTPEEDLKAREKIDITKNIKTKNSHERDALASALHAYQKNEQLIKKIERTVEGLNLWKHVEDVKDMVLRGRCNSVSEAIDIILSSKKTKGKKKKKDSSVITKNDADRILGKLRIGLKQKEKSISILKKYSKNLEKRIEELEKENKKIKKPVKKKKIKKTDYKTKNLENRIKEKTKKIRKLKKLIKTLRETEKIRKEGLIPVKIIKDSSIEELNKAEKKLGIEKDVLYFKNYSRIDKKTIEKLKEKNIEIIIGNFPKKIKEEIEKHDISVLDKNEINIKISKNCGKINPEKLKKAEKNSFVEWIKKYRKRSND